MTLYYTSKGFYISNQVKSRSICSLFDLSATGLYIKSLYYLVNSLTDKADIHITKKFLLRLVGLSSIPLLGVLMSDISHNLTSE